LFVGRETEKMRPLVQRMNLQAVVRLAGFRTDVPRLLPPVTFLSCLSPGSGGHGLAGGDEPRACPAIGTQVGGIPEILTHGQTGLLVLRRTPRRSPTPSCNCWRIRIKLGPWRNAARASCATTLACSGIEEDGSFLRAAFVRLMNSSVPVSSFPSRGA